MIVKCFGLYAGLISAVLACILGSCASAKKTSGQSSVSLQSESRLVKADSVAASTISSSSSTASWLLDDVEINLVPVLIAPDSLGASLAVIPSGIRIGKVSANLSSASSREEKSDSVASSTSRGASDYRSSVQSSRSETGARTRWLLYACIPVALIGIGITAYLALRYRRA